MKKFILLIGILFFILTGCVQRVTEDLNENLIDIVKLSSKANRIISTYTPEEVKQKLIKLAPIFAKAISEDNGFKELLTTEIAKKFDGDNNVLYDLVASKKTKKGKTVEQLIEQNIQLYSEEESINALVDSIPYFNISIPIHFDQWNTYNGPIYVIPMRYDIDDLKIESLPGYDANGNVRIFETANPPDFPVIVIGINERMPLLNAMTQNSKSSLKEAVNLLAETQRINHDEYLCGIKLVADLEPFYSGAPEVYALYAVGENGKKLYQPYEEIYGYNWFDYNKLILFSYDNSPQNMYWILKLRESDFDWGRFIDYTVSGGYTYAGENYNIVATFKSSEKIITNQDDDYGETQVYFSHRLNESGYTEYTVGGAWIRIGYYSY